MLRKIVVALFVITVFDYSDSAFVDILTPCPVNDPVCHKNLLQRVLRGIGKTGIPDIGVPPIDPFDLKNVTVAILDLVKITMVDGVVKGIKDCVVDTCQSYIEKEFTEMELICNVTIKGHYKVTANSPILARLLGSNSIHGEGHAKVVMDNLHIKNDYRFYPGFVKGEVFNEIPFETFITKYTIGKIAFAADNLYLGDQEASKLIMDLLNNNGQLIMDLFGKPFFDVATKIMYNELHKFVEKVPAKYYVLEDLRPYIKP